MAVGTKVSLAAIVERICAFWERVQHDRVGRLQRPVCTRICGMDRMAGTTILTRRIGITSVDRVGCQPRSHHVAEGTA